ncbi:iron ABC transporter permease [Mariniluteicoccus endophyticus]
MTWLTHDQRGAVELLRTPAAETTADMIRAPRTAFAGWLALAVVVMALLAMAGLLWGSVRVDPVTVVKILSHRVCGDSCVAPAWTRSQDLIIADARLPRVLLAALAGAGLATVGTVIQAVLRNPLADPGILGVSSGAATGAVLVLRLSSVGAVSMALLNTGALLGAVFAVGVVTLVAGRGHGGASRLILCGVAVSAILSATTSLVVLTSPDPTLAGQVLQWTLGGFGGTTWSDVAAPLVLVTACLAVLVPLSRLLNLAIMDEDAATSLGLDARRFRAVMVALCALVTAVIVSVSGVVSFVGLMMPHAARLLVGADHRRTLPLAAVLGAAFLVATDLVARTAWIPVELPVGIITSLVGGPAFVLLVRHRAGAR